MFLFGARQTRRRSRAKGGARARLLCEGILVSATAILSPQEGYADRLDVYPPANYNYYGEVGLIDMPTARFGRDGEISATFSSTPSMERYNLGFQALPWLETVFRYARLDRYYSEGPNGDLYDRSLSIRARLVQETDFWPAVAIGAQDILGTGAFGSEYLVASKKTGDFDFTAGIAWRRFGDVATFPNPIAWIFPSFKTATGFGNQGTGVPLLNQFFHGDHVGLFGGVTWRTPIDKLTLIAELSGDQSKVQAANNGIQVKMPFNFGFSYEPWEGVQIGGGYLYGSQLGLRITLHMNPFDNPYPEKLGTAPIAMQVRSTESRNQAEQALLQNTTHYYDDWPASEPTNRARGAISAAAISRSSTSIADVIFDRRESDLEITRVETYGDSLILQANGRRRDLSCAALTKLVDSALSAGFGQVVVSASRNPDDVLVCTHSSNTPMQNSESRPSLPVTEVQPEGFHSLESEEGSSVQLSNDALTSQSEKDKILKDAAAQFIGIQAIVVSDQEVDLAFANSQYRSEDEAIGRLIRILMADTPDSVEQFRLTSTAFGHPTHELLFHRGDIERIYNFYGSAYELLPSTEILSVPEDSAAFVGGSLLKFPTFGFSAAPGYRQSLFDPDNPYRFQFYASATGSVAFSREFSIAATIEANIYGNLNDITRVSNSVLPHVRSDFALYYKHGSNGIDQLTANYATKLTSDVYFSARAGYLEGMFAGLGGEIYWQPPHERFSFGAALYAVQQRDFNRLFGLRSYRVITGHLSAYYNSPWYGLNFQIHAGRYLAGDYGATFQITRRFANGIEIGAFATLTNVPFSEYGEGSFDKGFIIRIPLDTLVPINTQRDVNFDFSPLTRDGGQRVGGEEELYDIMRRSSESELLANWDKVLNP